MLVLRIAVNLCIQLALCMILAAVEVHCKYNDVSRFITSVWNITVSHEMNNSVELLGQGQSKTMN